MRQWLGSLRGPDSDGKSGPDNLETLRAIFDANLYLNLLLSRDPDRTLIAHLLRAAARLEFELLLPEDLVRELRDVVARRPYLAARVNPEALAALLNRILQVATSLPLLDQEPPPISRDTNDDYLIALAVIHNSDYIVTRDRDLLDLGEVGGVRIVDPKAFREMLSPEFE